MDDPPPTGSRLARARLTRNWFPRCRHSKIGMVLPRRSWRPNRSCQLRLRA
jgi:hypothetical protein